MTSGRGGFSLKKNPLPFVEEKKKVREKNKVARRIEVFIYVAYD